MRIEKKYCFPSLRIKLHRLFSNIYLNIGRDPKKVYFSFIVQKNGKKSIFWNRKKKYGKNKKIQRNFETDLTLGGW